MPACFQSLIVALGQTPMNHPSAVRQRSVSFYVPTFGFCTSTIDVAASHAHRLLLRCFCFTLVVVRGQRRAYLALEHRNLLAASGAVPGLDLNETSYCTSEIERVALFSTRVWGDRHICCFPRSEARAMTRDRAPESRNTLEFANGQRTGYSR
jgi:hypothetical protein